MFSFLSDGAEYLAPAANRLGNTTLRDIGNTLMGRGQMAPIQKAFGKDARNLANMIPGVGPKAAVT